VPTRQKPWARSQCDCESPEWRVHPSYKGEGAVSRPPSGAQQWSRQQGDPDAHRAVIPRWTWSGMIPAWSSSSRSLMRQHPRRSPTGCPLHWAASRGGPPTSTSPSATIYASGTGVPTRDVPCQMPLGVGARVVVPSIARVFHRADVLALASHPVGAFGLCRPFAFSYSYANLHFLYS
jgi:hypothetical protein